MEILDKQGVLGKRKNILALAKSGYVFIYPTDTIYGIGCDATNRKVVQKIRDTKQRQETPFSVIAPSKKWVAANCVVKPFAKKFIAKLPGPYTLIFRLKNRKAVARNVSLGNTLGIRIPKHWFTRILQKSKLPIVTTSANIHGQPYMTSLDDLSPEIRNKVDFIVYEGERKGGPSRIINLTGDKPKEIKR